ncbi:MAG: beta-ketoacyl-ACP synthase II [Chloroflexota bacterium]
MFMERVVVTGMGTVNSTGFSVQESWQNVINGVGGTGLITQVDTSEMLVKIACEVKDFNPENYMSGQEVRRRDRYGHFATAAAQEAMRQAGLQVTEENAGQIGVVFSSAIGGLNTIVENTAVLREKGPRRVSPFLIPMMITDGAAASISLDFGLQGPSYSVVTACASGSDALGIAWMMLRTGMADVIVAGGSDAPISPLGVAAFDRIGALSRRNDDFSMTPQPFDKNRDGLVMGEGAGVLVLERESHARARGAEMLAEFAGYGASSDAFHITAPHEDGVGGARAMNLALDAAGVNPDQLGYINAHGTSTPLNDAAETKAIKRALGELAYNIPVSSTKSMTGHMMGATGAVEAIFCIQAIRDGILPPTIHYQTPDPACDLDVVPNQARRKPISVAMSNAFGFGGHNAVVVIRKI